jgi:hypothetical protein
MEKIEFYHYILEDRDSCILIKKNRRVFLLTLRTIRVLLEISLYSNISKSVIFYYERSLSFCVNCVTHSACGVLA